jgi:Na+-driven multidrug efflux pump
MVYTSTMRAAGAVWVPLLVVGVALFPVRIGFYELTYGWLGADAIWLSFPVAAFTALALGWWFYHYWHWRFAAPPLAPAIAAEGAQAEGLPTARLKPEI